MSNTQFIHFDIVMQPPGSVDALQKNAGAGSRHELTMIALGWMKAYQGLLDTGLRMIAFEKEDPSFFSCIDPDTIPSDVSPLQVEMEIPDTVVAQLRSDFLDDALEEVFTKSFLLLDRIIDAQSRGLTIGTLAASKIPPQPEFPTFRAPAP